MGADDMGFQPCGAGVGKSGGIGRIDIGRHAKGAAIGALHQIKQHGAVPVPGHLRQLTQMLCAALGPAVGGFDQPPGAGPGGGGGPGVGAGAGPPGPTSYHFS